MRNISINFLNSFKKLLEDEPIVSGKSMMFTLNPKMKNDLMIRKLDKKIQKKEKRLDILTKATKQSFIEKDKIMKKKKEMEARKQELNNQIEEEEKEIPIEELAKSLEEA